VPTAYAAHHAQLLRACMINALPLKVPSVVDMEFGSSWGDLQEMRL
jgi:DNA polymerase I-like protein with 3'-5' exonuclease and polymerase domains